MYVTVSLWHKWVWIHSTVVLQSWAEHSECGTRSSVHLFFLYNGDNLWRASVLTCMTDTHRTSQPPSLWSWCCGWRRHFAGKVSRPANVPVSSPSFLFLLMLTRRLPRSPPSLALLPSNASNLTVKLYWSYVSLGAPLRMSSTDVWMFTDDDDDEVWNLRSRCSHAGAAHNVMTSRRNFS